METTAPPAAEPMPPMSVWLWPVVAAWAIPGAGHFLLKKSGRGLLLFACVIIMFLLGLSMQGMMFSPEKGTDYLTTLINYGGFVSDLAAGGVYILTMMFGYSMPDMPGDVHDYGTKFIVTAGLLNILAMVDAFEIATRKKD